MTHQLQASRKIYLVVLIYLFLYLSCCSYLFVYVYNALLFHFLVEYLYACGFLLDEFYTFPRHYVRSTARGKDSSSLGIQEKQYCCFYLFVHISIYLIVPLSCSSIYFVVFIYLVALFTCLFILLHLFTCSSIYIVHSFYLLIVLYIASSLSLSLSQNLKNIFYPFFFWLPSHLRE